MDETVSSVGTFASPEKKVSKINEFKILGNLGEGSFSTVYKVQRYADSKIYAMKKVRMSRLTEREKSNALNEIRILASTKSDHIVEYKDSFFDGSSDSLCIVMEYAENGDLLQKLNEIKMQNKRNLEDSLLKTPSEKIPIPNIEEEASVVSIGQVESIVKVTKNYVNSEQYNTTLQSEQLDSTQNHESPKKKRPIIILDSQINQNSLTDSNIIDPLKESTQVNRSAANQNLDNSHQILENDNHCKNWIYMPEEQVWDYLIQCAKGLECLHSMGIVHRDLKCANVLISQHNIVKIGDLNVSVVTRKESHLGKTHPGGTPFYTAPEVWSGHACDFKSDVWSLGCVAYELCAQKPPFEGTTLAGLCANILKGSFRRIPKIYSEELAAVIELCLTFKATERPSSSELLLIPEIQTYLKAYYERYSQYLKCFAVQKLHGAMEHLSPQRQAKRNLLEQQHLIDTINLPSNLKKLSPLLPRAHYEDILHLPSVAEFQLSRQDHRNLFDLNEIKLFQQDKGCPQSNLMVEKYHDLAKYSPIRFNLQKVAMDESRLLEEEKEQDRQFGDEIHKNLDGSYHELAKTDIKMVPIRSEESFQNNKTAQQQVQAGQYCLELSKKQIQIEQMKSISTSNNIIIDKNKFNEEEMHKINENASRLKMLSEYLEKLRAKPQRQQQQTVGYQFGMKSICRDFENVLEAKQTKMKLTQALSRDSSSEEQGGTNTKKKNKETNHVSFSFLEQNAIKNNNKTALVSDQSMNHSDQGNNPQVCPPNSNSSQVSQKIQLMSNLINYQIHDNNQTNNLPVNSSQDISQVKHHYAQINSSFIHNNLSNGNKNNSNLQKTLTTNDSVDNLSPPIRRTRRILSHQSNNYSNVNSMNHKEDQQTVGIKPKSTSPQPRFTQFSQVLRKYLPKNQNYQNRIASVDRQPALSVVAVQVSRSPPIVMQKRIVLSAKITSSKGAQRQQLQQQPPSHSFHVASRSNQQSDQGQAKFTTKDENNQENIFASSNYPSLSHNRGHSSRIQRQFKEPCQHPSIVKNEQRIVKLAHICNKHNKTLENTDTSIFYDNTKDILGDKNGILQQQQIHHLQFHTDRNNKERNAFLQSVRNQLGPMHNKNSVSQPNPHQFLPKTYNQNERKHHFAPVFLR